MSSSWKLVLWRSLRIKLVSVLLTIVLFPRIATFDCGHVLVPEGYSAKLSRSWNALLEHGPSGWLSANTTRTEPLNNIYGGNRSADPEGKYPFMAMLFGRYLNGSAYTCGASILSSNYLLTAAHCLRYMDVTGSKVKIGADNPYQDSTNIFPLSSVTAHPSFDLSISNWAIQVNDIGVMQTQTPMVLTDRIQQICLYGNGSDYDYSEAIAIGWGWFSEAGVYYNGSTGWLREVKIPILPFPPCHDYWLASTGLNITNATNLCAGAPGKGGGLGDSGGPLMIHAPSGEVFQIGVQSFVSMDLYHQNAKPNVLSRVEGYCDFIRSATNNEAFCGHGTSATLSVLFLSFVVFRQI